MFRKDEDTFVNQSKGEKMRSIFLSVLIILAIIYGGVKFSNVSAATKGVSVSDIEEAKREFESIKEFLPIKSNNYLFYDVGVDGSEIDLFYKSLEIDKKNMSEEDLKNFVLLDSDVNAICQNDQLEKYINKGFDVVQHYVDKNEKKLLDVKVSKDRCNDVAGKGYNYFREPDNRDIKKIEIESKKTKFPIKISDGVYLLNFNLSPDKKTIIYSYKIEGVLKKDLSPSQEKVMNANIYAEKPKYCKEAAVLKLLDMGFNLMYSQKDINGDVLNEINIDKNYCHNLKNSPYGGRIGKEMAPIVKSDIESINKRLPLEDDDFIVDKVEYMNDIGVKFDIKIKGLSANVSKKKFEELLKEKNLDGQICDLVKNYLKKGLNTEVDVVSFSNHNLKKIYKNSPPDCGTY